MINVLEVGIVPGDSAYATHNAGRLAAVRQQTRALYWPHVGPNEVTQYYLNQSIDMLRSECWHGDGRSNTRLEFTGVTADYAIKVGERSRIDNLGIYANPINSLNSDGLVWRGGGTHRNTLHDVTIGGFVVNAVIGRRDLGVGAWIVNFREVFLGYATDAGLVIAADVNSFHYRGGEIQTQPTGIRLESIARTCVLESLTIEANTQYGIHVKGPSTSNPRSVVIEKCYFEANPQHIEVDGQEANLAIRNNGFYTDKAVKLIQSKHVDIATNHYESEDEKIVIEPGAIGTCIHEPGLPNPLPHDNGTGTVYY